MEVNRVPVSRKRDDVLDSRTDIDGDAGNKTYPAGADVPGSLGAICSLLAQLQNAEGELQPVCLSLSLFQ